MLLSYPFYRKNAAPSRCTCFPDDDSFFRESTKKACKTGSDVISYHGVKRAVLCRRCPERVGRRIHDGTNAYINRRKYPWI
jgi:hypothetical protein